MTHDDAVAQALRIVRARRRWTADPIAQTPDRYGIFVRTSSGTGWECWTLEDVESLLIHGSLNTKDDDDAQTP